MRFLTRLLIAVCSVVPVVSQATEQWSSCQTIEGVANYQAYNGDLVLALSPGISGCSYGTTTGIVFVPGTDGVTSSNINSLLATSLAAFATGTQVTIYYDNTSTCYGVIVADGGQTGQC